MATIQKKARMRFTQEAAAGGAITPGHFVQYSGVDTVVVHATAGGPVLGNYIALEDQASGGSTTDAYASGARVVLTAALPGEQYEVIASAAIAANASVESTGDGRVRTLASGTATGRALTAAASAGDRITIEIV